jgi:hypothetical protein
MWAGVDGGSGASRRGQTTSDKVSYVCTSLTRGQPEPKASANV